MKPHIRNTNFEWVDRRGPFRRITEEQARQYDEQGYFLLEDAFDADTIAELVAAIDPHEARFEAFLREQAGGKAFIARAGEISFTAHLVEKSDVARAFTEHAVFRDVCFDLLGPDVRLYWDQAVYKKPGTNEPFPWHQDNGYTYVEPQRYLTCWVALTDATPDNGCPWVLPEVHRQGTLAHEPSDLGFVCATDPPGAIAAPVSAGSMLVFSSLTPHATGPNQTSDVRKSYIVQFAPDGARIVQGGADQTEYVLANVPTRQYPILVGGEPPTSTDC